MGWLVADTALDEFAEFCSTLILENGSNMELQPFQRWLLRPYFDGYAETAICVPTGNGKTSLLGALALYHAMNTQDANVVLAAAARDQAARMLEQAGGFVRRTPYLDKHFKLQLYGNKRIIGRKTGSLIRAIAADAHTADGEIPTLVCVDELHRHKSSELYGVLRDKCAKRQGQILSISTAGDSEESPLGRLRTKALSLPSALRNGVEVTADDEDSGFAWRELSLTDDDVTAGRHEDFELVKLVNPLDVHTPQSLRTRYLSASMEPWQWARFTCGVWLGGENSAFDAVAWRNCGRWPDIAEGTHVWLGVDLGWRYDSTALVPFHFDESQDIPDGSPEVVGLPTIIEAPGDGTSTSHKAVLTAISAIHKRTPIDVIVIDPNAEAGFLIEQMGDSERWPELNSIEVIEHSQNPDPMADACMGLAESIRAGRIAHPDGSADFKDYPRLRERASALTSHVLAAGVKSTSGNKWRIVKQKGGRKIDAAVALAMVRAKRLEKPKRPKVTANTYVGWKI